MRPPRPTARLSLSASVLLHLGAAVITLVLARRQRPAPTAADATESRPIELELAEAPPPAETTQVPAATGPITSASPTPTDERHAERSVRRSGDPVRGATTPMTETPVAPPPPVLTAPPESRPPLRAADLMRVPASVAMGVWGAAPSIAEAQAERRRARALVDLPSGTPESRAAAASQGHVGELLAATHQHEAAGVRGYYWSLRRRMVESWRPGVSRMPTLGETLLSTLATPVEALAQIQRSAAGSAVEPGRMGSAIDSLEGRNTARSNNPAERTQAPFTGIIDASRGNTRRTRAEVEVVQGDDGQVLSVRVLRSSRIPSFDRAAEAAVREALPLQSPVAMPGGRRSRWSFEVVASRDPFVPGLGFEFDESSGWFELHWPGRAHVRSRVWLEGASPVSSPPRAPPS